MHKGRISSAALNVIPMVVSEPRPKVNPITSLSGPERRLFDTTARLNPHLKQADAATLELYVMAYRRAMRARQKDSQNFERATRLLMALGRTLRITPQSTVEPRAAAKLRRDAAAESERKPWHRS